MSTSERLAYRTTVAVRARASRRVFVMVVLVMLSVSCDDPVEPARPHALTIVSGNGQGALPGEALTEPLRVRVSDDRDQPLAGVPVTWSVVEGRATVTPLTSTTTADGTASATVRLADARAGASVQASVAGVAPVTFEIPVRNPCNVDNARPMSTGSAVRGTLRGDLDCVVNETFIFDLYRISTGSTQALSFRVSAQTFEPGFILFAQAPDGGYYDRAGASAPEGSRQISVSVLMPPGAYSPSVASFTGNVGAYEMIATLTSSDATRCEPLWILQGVTTEQQLESSDCHDAPGPAYRDLLYVTLWRGERVIISHTSAAFAPRLKLLRRTGLLVRQADGAAGTSAVIEFTADETALYQIHATSVETQRTGPYTLALNRAQ